MTSHTRTLKSARHLQQESRDIDSTAARHQRRVLVHYASQGCMFYLIVVASQTIIVTSAMETLWAPREIRRETDRPGDYRCHEGEEGEELPAREFFYNGKIERVILVTTPVTISRRCNALAWYFEGDKKAAGDNRLIRRTWGWSLATTQSS